MLLATTLGTFADNTCADGTWSLNAYTMAEGANVFTVSGEDSLGNPTSDTITITLDTTAPTITVTAPNGGADFTTAIASQTVSGTCSTDTVNLATTLGTFNDSSCADGTWSLNAYTMAEGANVFTISGEDGLGNPTSDTITITLDTTAPTITVTAPNGGADFTTNTASQPTLSRRLPRP